MGRAGKVKSITLFEGQSGWPWCKWVQLGGNVRPDEKLGDIARIKLLCASKQDAVCWCALGRQAFVLRSATILDRKPVYGGGGVRSAVGLLLAFVAESSLALHSFQELCHVHRHEACSIGVKGENPKTHFTGKICMLVIVVSIADHNLLRIHFSCPRLGLFISVGRPQ